MIPLLTRNLTTFGILAFTAVFGWGAEARIGEPAPAFTLTDIEGESHELADYAGKTIVLEWVNPDCPFVKKHYQSGNLPSLQTMATEEGVIWLVINSAAPGKQGDYDSAAANTWLTAMGASPTAYFRDQDGVVGHLYGAKATPHMYVVNPAGILVYNGAIDSIPSANIKDLAKAENYVTAALTAVAAGELPAKQSTQPYGCAMKY